MALSNTAVPKYYGIFRERVLRGEIPVCYEISLQMNRTDANILNPNFYYDDGPVEGFIKYCENELTLTDGSPVVLTDFFKLLAEDLYGWYYFEERSVPVPIDNHHGTKYVKKRIKRRLIRKQMIIMGRGAAKSMYLSFVQSYEQNINPATTQGVTTAPTMKQAEEVITPLATAISRARGPYIQFLTESGDGQKLKKPKLYSGKKGIVNEITNSIIEIKPMTIDKLQGSRAPIVTIDEWLSGVVREDVITAAEQGASKTPNYILIATSSEGNVRNGSGDNIKIELMKILKGEYINPHCSIWWFKLDTIEEVGHPELWIKANPNLGITVGYDVYQQEVEKAEKIPSSRNEILAKRFGLPMEGYTYFFTFDETIPFKQREFWGLPCALGADLSRGDDFTSFTFLFPLKDGSYGVKTRNYITELTLMRLPLTLRNKYDEFINEGSLIVMEGTVLDLDEVYDELINYITACDYDICCFGFDPYNAKAFVNRWELEHGPFGIEKVPQGSRTESVPLGELKKLAEERLLYFDQLIMQFAMGNCITIEDTNGNRKLLKERRDQKIDCVAALMDAYVAYKVNKDTF